MIEPNIEPVIYTPLTRFTLSWFNYQTTKCAGYELDLYDCAMRGSKTNAKKICWKQYHDFMECVKGWTQLKRYVEMRQERRKQGRPYMPPPPADVIPPNNPY
ncbi:hypothetical protein CHS0354_010646 [Potamilus streckersoni]|uniref:NADH dehydrogenase [ubiquinone] iron-sulfur protein 5 n=1 Tax=Potamilus streckersoni TaxID=2493646 RepID=A0AAE0TC47_9BIVA|nr:hypothetical protein CHS0354_010646 [Potamilus streckersoni]